MAHQSDGSVPRLDISNSQPWVIAIQCLADAMGISAAVDDPQFLPDQFNSRACAALTAKIIESLPHSMAAQVVTPEVRRRPGHIVRQVQQLTHQATPADRHALLVDAENTVLENYDTVDTFFEAHRAIRTRMISAAYPNIQDETTTVEIIIRGLRDHPDFQTVIPVWTSDPPPTVNALRSRVKAVHGLAQRRAKVAPIPFSGQSATPHHPRTLRAPPPTARPGPRICQFHTRLGRPLPHADHECRHPHNPLGVAYRPHAQAYPQPSQHQPHNPYAHPHSSTAYPSPSYSAPPTAYSQHTSPHQHAPGTHPPARQYKSGYKARAKQATTGQQPHVHFNLPPGFPADDYHNTRDHDDDGKLPTPRIILDSGAHPSHTPTPGPLMAPKTTSHTLTATHHSAPLTHAGPLDIITPLGPIRTRAVTAPTIPDTLISVRDLTTPRRAVIFTTNRAYLIPSKLLPHDCLQQPIAQWDQDAYIIPTIQRTANTAPTKHARYTTSSSSTALFPQTTQPHPIANLPTPNLANPQRAHTPVRTTFPAMQQPTADTPNSTDNDPLTASDFSTRHIPLPNPSPDAQTTTTPRLKKPHTTHRTTSNKLRAAMPHHIQPTHLTSLPLAWHLALNHAPLDLLRHIAEKRIFPALTPAVLRGTKHITCSSCADGKSAQAPHPPSNQRHTAPGDVISTDTMGPITPASARQHRHILTFIDDSSRFALAIPISHRSKLSTLIPQTLMTMARHHGHMPHTLHSDNAKEYTSSTIITYLASHGIRQTLTTPHQPQQNSRAERFNRTIMNATRAALSHSRLPTKYWDFAVLDATYKYNCLPHASTKTTPLSQWDPNAPTPPYFLPFGAAGAIPDFRPKQKLQSRARPARYLCHQSATLISILYTDTQTIGLVRLIDFHPTHPALDPATLLASAFKARSHHPTPELITPATLPPSSTSQAHRYPDAHLWAHAHNAEIDQLDDQGAIIWEQPDCIPPHTKPISLTMAYRYKRSATGVIIQRKARCSVRGDLMRPHEHFDPSATAAYAADKATVRLVLATAANQSQPLNHFDITSAFTHEEYKFAKPVYIRQPRRFDGTLTHPDRPIGRLKLNLYGSKPACNIYHQGLDKHLQAHGYYPTEADPCLYTKTTSSGCVLIAVTIDDFLVTAPAQSDIDQFATVLRIKYTVKDLRTPTRYLGWSITRKGTGPIHISQPSLITKILTSNNMADDNPRSTPLPKNADYDDSNSSPQLPPSDTERFQSTLGDIRYLADGTRPDIAYAASRLAKHTHKPTTAHQHLLKHLTRYLKHTTHSGILYTIGATSPLTTHSDADYAASTDRHSITGAIHTAFGAPILWTSRRQPTVALSTCEAEYVAASHALQDLLWLRNLSTEIRPQSPMPPSPFYVDNKSALDVATHQSKTRRRKHIDIKQHHLQHHVKHKSITLKHIPSAENTADIFTKALPKPQFQILSAHIIHPNPNR